MKSTEQTARKVLKCEDCQAKYDNGCDGGICPELEDCIAVAEIQRKMTIDKACEWLKSRIDVEQMGAYNNEWVTDEEKANKIVDECINSFRKAMEEE